jgi:hypothetical protein
MADIRQDHLDQALAWFAQRKAPAHGIRLEKSTYEDYDWVRRMRRTG